MVSGARRSAVFVLSALACASIGAAGADRPQVLFGFSAADSAAQQTLEQRFDAALNPADLDGWLKSMASEANHVGAPHDKANAEFTRDQFQQWGWDANIEVFYPLYPTLKSHILEMVAPTKFVAKLKEPAVEGDATSTRTDGMGPYNVYGADGDVTGELVYVNFGMPDDYKDLARGTDAPTTRSTPAPEGPANGTTPDGSFVLTEVTPVGSDVTGPVDVSFNSVLPPGTAINNIFTPGPGSGSPLDTVPILPPPVGSDVITP